MAIGVTTLIVIVAIAVVQFIRESSQRKWEASQPVIPISARVTGKRLEVDSDAAASLLGRGISTNVSTAYFVTFETSDGDRHELPVSGTDYGLLAEGDHGILSSQGTQYRGFERDRGTRERIAQR